jgi:hypothetical protein
MVHALHLVHGILQPNGLLINVHDLPAPHVLEVHSSETVHKVGWLTDKEDFENTRFSLNALVQVVEDRHFVLEDEQNFGYNIYADELDEFQEWLAEWWSSVILTNRIFQRLEELTRDADKSTRIVCALQARMSKLRVA